MFTDADITHVYTREDALSEGVLVEISPAFAKKLVSYGPLRRKREYFESR